MLNDKNNWFSSTQIYTFISKKDAKINDNKGRIICKIRLWFTNFHTKQPLQSFLTKNYRATK